MKKIIPLTEEHLKFIEKLSSLKLTPDLNSLDQLFLINNSFHDNLLDFADLNKNDIVLEIGPGTGEFARKLSKHVKKVIAIELDKNLKEALKIMPKNVEVIFDDAKKYLMNEKDSFNKIISSPPYNLCEPLMHILTKKPNIELVILITPVGFYEKINNNPIFSSFFDFEKLKDIPKVSFYPIPRIDSEIIRITNKPGYEVDKNDNSFIIRSLYTQKDKVIKNALRSTLISLFKLKNKILTKNNARELIKKMNLSDEILNKKMQNFKPEFYLEIINKLSKLI
jgi:16S rRNA (adenine1518-N6/adenine1519-N6)-dimethyltransferase